MKKDKLNMIYKVFVKCNNKQTYTLDITRYYKELVFMLEEAGIMTDIKEISCKLIMDLFITSFAFCMFDLKEVLLEMFSEDYPFLEPEAEMLIIAYFEEVMNDLYASTPILKNSGIILPYDVVHNNCETFTLKLAICLDKNN